MGIELTNRITNPAGFLGAAWDGHRMALDKVRDAGEPMTKAADQGRDETTLAPGLRVYVANHDRTAWLGRGKNWVSNRADAVVFQTSIEAIACCVGLRLSGRVIAFGVFDTITYDIDATEVLRAFRGPSEASTHL